MPDLRMQRLGLYWVDDAVFVRDQAKELLQRERVTGVRFSRPLLHGRAPEMFAHDALFLASLVTVLSSASSVACSSSRAAT